MATMSRRTIQSLPDEILMKIFNDGVGIIDDSDMEAIPYDPLDEDDIEINVWCASHVCTQFKGLERDANLNQCVRFLAMYDWSDSLCHTLLTSL